ncbi:MAG: DUF1565 domain-containing protein [Spirulina sp.]
MRPRFLPLQRLSSTALWAALALMATPALAQTAAPGSLQPRVSAPTEPPTYTLIHVNASSGSNTSGDGSQLRPYQTITHALGIATANSIVLLAPGEYSEASGERFPIQLRTGVTVQGSPNSGLGETVIRGSGIFASTTAGMVQATLIGADGAGLGHVTVTNTSTAGYGLVIEAGRPAIRQNQFVGSGYGGAYVSGNSAPVLEGNQFSRNGVVGLVLEGHTAAEVRGNRFEQTGIGIRVAPGAQPQIINNTIVQNQEGLLLDGNANPHLQDNVIAQNRRNGVVEFQTALKAEDSAPEAILPTMPAVPAVLQAPPTTGTPLAMVPQALTAAPPAQVSPMLPGSSPQGAVATAMVEPPPRAPAPASSVAPPPEAASPTATAVASPVAMTSAPAEANPPVLASRSATPLPDSLPLARLTSSASPQPAPAAAPARPNAPTLATETTALAVPVPGATASPSASAAQPSATVVAARESLRRWRQSSQAAQGTAATPETTSEASSEAVPIAVIPPPVDTVARASELPGRPAAQLVAAQSSRPVASAQPASVSSPSAARPTNPDLLPVPSRTIPVGSGGSAIPNLAPPSTVTALNGAPPAPPSYGGLLGLVYKVVVPAADSTSQAQVRAAVADAFRVNLGGQTMMQVGAYADEATAEARANELIAQGFEARVEYRP